MGQAKQRGNFEERKAQSILKTQQESAAAMLKMQEWWDSLTEEEQKGELSRRALGRKKVMELMSLMGLASSY